MPRTMHIFVLLLVAIAAEYTLPWLRGRGNDAPAVFFVTKSRLDTRLSRVDYDHRPACEVVEDLGARVGVAVIVDRASLAAEGIDAEQPISVRLFNVRGRRALDIACASMSDAAPQWRIYERDGRCVVVAGRSDRTGSCVGTYHFSGLLDDARYMYQDLQADILGLVMATVEPDSWVDVGGTVGRCGFIGGDRLVVVQRPFEHRQVSSLTEQLHAQFQTRYLLADRLFYPSGDTERRSGR